MMSLGNLIYKKKWKILFGLLQIFAAGMLAYCLLSIGFWMEDSFSLREMSKSYEETDLFFRQVDEILRHKIRGQENNELFEEDGEFSDSVEVDIQSYGGSGRGSSLVKDMNTTYLLKDLLEFCENGGSRRLHDEIQAAMEGNSQQKAGEILDERSEELETVIPVTGISLSECSRWYSDPASFVLNMYIRLDVVCTDIYERYQEYTQEQDESWSSQAPGNLWYCIEDVSANTLFTNSGAESYEEAAELLKQSQYTPLYEGERSFNIVVVNQDNVLNEDANEWFMDELFVDTNERVLLGVDTSYPVSDALQANREFFSRREGIVWGSLLAGGISAAVLAVCFGLTLAGAGWEEGKIAPRLYSMDRIPTELSACLCLVVTVLILLALSMVPEPENLLDQARGVVALLAAGGWLAVLVASTSLMRRVRAGTLWQDSICRMLVRTWNQVTSARTASGRLLVFYLIFFVLNFVFLLFGQVGIFLVLMLDLAVLLYLLRDMTGKQSVFEGIQQISKGDLKYRIDLTALQGESYEMARAVNEMGDGLQEAVDAIVKNERLKAELITNVSHDIKTPLTSIVNYVDLLKRENLEGERVRHYIEVLDQKSQRLRQLTEDLVEASKISSGNVELHMMKIQLQSMLNQAYGEFEDRMEEKGLRMELDFVREPLCIMADGRHFWRVLENLLGNIYKYALEGSQVWFTLERREDQAVITLKNICRERLTIGAEELTGRFVRGDRSRNTEGSGLGLSIAENLTRLQGGEFDLSVEEDVFRVILTFPLAEEETKEQAEAAKDQRGNI